MSPAGQNRQKQKYGIYSYEFVAFDINGGP